MLFLKVDLRFSTSNRDFNVSEMTNSDEMVEAHTGLSSRSESFTSTNPESKDPPPVKSSNKPRRKNLTTAERLRIINDFKHGVPDKYYSVNPNPRRPGEFIVRKRKTPIEYDIEQCEGLTTMNPKGESPNHKRNNSIPSIASDQALSKTPSQLLTESTPPHNPLAGTEFFSMQSSLNANLQRELDALHEKFNKLDAKFRKERAARKNKVQADTPKAKTLQEKPARSRKSKSRALSPKGEQTRSMSYNPFGLARRPNIDIRDF